MSIWNIDAGISMIDYEGIYDRLRGEFLVSSISMWLEITPMYKVSLGPRTYPGLFKWYMPTSHVAAEE